MKELEKIYDPSSVEDKHYKKWVDAGYFHAERDPDKRPYTIVMPPPNITGQLHMGHAMDETWQDILIRCRAMPLCGCRAPTMRPLPQRRRSWRR